MHPPFRRDPQRVLDDVLEGYVSKREARRTYGVIITDGRVSGLTAARKAAGNKAEAVEKVRKPATAS